MKKYIKVPRISNQKLRQKYYSPESITHPAKADIPMMIWILKKFVEDGDVVFDPMCGIGTTLIEGMRLFPNSLFIGGELEDKFVKMTQANIKKTETIAKKDMFMKIGKAVCIEGDARDLGKLLKEKADKIISSPPFQQAGTDTEKRMKKRLDKVFKGRSYVPTQKYRDIDNISNIKPYGQVNKIISSPPFGQAQSGGGIAKKGYDGPKHTPTDMVGKRSYMPENIGSEKNIGNFPYGEVNKIITSPPYSEKNEPFISKSYLRIRQQTGRNINWPSQRYLAYSQNPDNIGNLKDKTYLGEMLKVYRECFKVLKSAGLMILITKDFIRDKKRVSLGEDTVKLCERSGFVFKEIYHRKIEHASFWRILYQQKYPEVEKIDSEEILVFEKNTAR